MPLLKVFGPPGSGKTTYLLNVVEQELATVHPSAIGYFAFTRKAPLEAKERAIIKFPHLNPDVDFPWFRTLHSLAYQCLGVSSKDIMKAEHYQQFAEESGILIGQAITDEDFVIHADNPILNEINIARIKGLDLRTHYNNSRLDIEWHHFEYVERAYRHFKEVNGLLDFTDLLELINAQPERLPTLTVVILDEAQDLSRLQWDIVHSLADKAQRAFIAGDDDQALYNWAGADVDSFLNCEGAVKVLDQSYRVPARVHALANQVVHRIKKRQPKEWRSRDYAGAIHYYNDFMHIDITTGEWLVLASANYMFNELYAWIKSQGLLFERHGQRSVPESIMSAVAGWESLRKGRTVNYPVLKNIYKYLRSEYVARGFRNLRSADPEALFSLADLKKEHGLLSDGIWHEALAKIGEEKIDYIIAILRRGTKLTGKVQIKLSTIHGAKGGEADNVLLLTDLSTKFAKEYDHNADDINRLLYVAVTRTREVLHIVQPKNTLKAFRF